MSNFKFEHSITPTKVTKRIQWRDRLKFDIYINIKIYFLDYEGSKHFQTLAVQF